MLVISTASCYGLRKEPGSAWFHRAQAFGAAQASWQAEQYALAILFQIVMLYAGPQWLQRRLRGLGTSYREILDQLRFQRACRMLRQTDMPVAAIAEELGYRHLGNFSRGFLRLSGLSPQGYRRA